MNTDNGKIRSIESDDDKKINEILIANEEMTAKQSEELQVSKYDNRSKLGKKFTNARKEKKRQRKHSRRFKKN